MKSGSGEAFSKVIFCVFTSEYHVWRLKLCECFFKFEGFSTIFEVLKVKKAQFGFITTPGEVFVKFLRDHKDF